MKLLRELTFFGAIGVVGFLVDTAVLYSLKSTLGPFAARAASFFAAATTTWFLNRRITFSGNTSNLQQHKELFAYLGLMLVGGAVNFACYTWLILSYEVAAKHLFIAVAAGSLAGMAFNFFSSRILLFRRQ